MSRNRGTGYRRPPMVAWSVASVAALGAIVMLGWILDVPALRTLLPATNPMVPTTATCFLISAAALWLASGPPRPTQRRLAAGMGAAVAAIGVLVLCRYAFGLELGMERLLYRSSALPYTGRMANPTAVSFVLLGVALMMLSGRSGRGTVPSQVLAACSVVIPALTMIGRLYGVSDLETFAAGQVAMAIPTAMAMIAISAGILAARPDRGFVALIVSDRPGGWLIRRLLPAAGTSLVLLGWLRILGERLGLYPAAFGVALMVGVSLALISVLFFLAARSLNSIDDRRHAADRARRESEGFRDAVLRSLGDGVVITDERGSILSVNPAMEVLGALSASEVIGRSYEDVYPLVDAEGSPVASERRLLGQALASKEVVSSRGFDIALVANDGRHVPVAMTAAPVLDSEGNLLGGVDIVRDVSHEREVDTMKSALVSTVSHELRTPLTMISGFAELLLSRDLDPERARRAASRIHVSAERLDRLIEDLLSVSRIDSGAVTIQPEDLDLEDVIAEALDPFVDRRPISVEVGDLPPVRADRDMLLRILTNLVSNAVKYSEDGSPIAVSAAELENTVSVSVSDRGIGMDEAELARLFDKFFRSERDEVLNQRGTGLGLYITKSLVELQGGRIDVRSTRDEGTTFTFTLPVASSVPALARTMEAS